MVSFSLLAVLSFSAGLVLSSAFYPCYFGRCGNTSHETILQRYKGLFFTFEEIQKIEEQRSVNRVKFLKRQVKVDTTVVTVDIGEAKNVDTGDADVCCPTKISYLLPLFMYNITGYLKPIVHMPWANPPRYQLVSSAKCLRQHANCDGLCIVEPIMVTLLAVEEGNLVFDFFNVYGYCSCKNIDNKPSI